MSPDRPTPQGPTGPTGSTSSPLTRGSSCIVVTDLHYAVALLSVGVPLVRAPECYEFGNARKVIFHFAESDAEGEVPVAQFAYAATEPLRFIAEHPTNPLSYAIAAMMMLPDIVRKFESARPVVAMTTEGAEGPTIYFAKDSRKHRAAIKAGMVPQVTRPTSPSALATLCNPSLTH